MCSRCALINPNGRRRRRLIELMTVANRLAYIFRFLIVRSGLCMPGIMLEMKICWFVNGIYGAIDIVTWTPLKQLWFLIYWVNARVLNQRFGRQNCAASIGIVSLQCQLVQCQAAKQAVLQAISRHRQIPDGPTLQDASSSLQSRISFMLHLNMS